MSIIKIFYDVETTGENPNKHSLHQVAGLIEVDEQVVEEFNIYSRPHPKAAIEPEALKVCKVTEEEIMAYPAMKDAKTQFCRTIAKYINKYDKNSKAYLVGFNNRGFDDKFLRMWFTLCDDPYFGSWFWADSRDTLVLASEYLEDRRTSMPNFQLHTVAETLGIKVEESKLQDAFYDVSLTRQIYRIVTGREIEL